MKTVVAVKPFIYPSNSNFKLAVYNAWLQSGGRGLDGRWYEKYYQSFSYHFHFPTIHEKKKVSRLCFVEGASLLFDTFPDYLFYEIIPVIWDCWPRYWESMKRFFIKHNVRTAFFTSSQTAEKFREFFPDRHIFFLPEAIETELYIDNKKLQDRHIDFLQYGRCSTIIDAESLPDTINVVSSRDEKGGIKTRHDLIDALSNSKLTIALTRQDNQPEIAEGIDTLTQRYWECMLSGVILLGRAPQELIDIIGYDPTIPIDMNNINQHIQSILKDVTSYQELVDKNREIAMRLGDWKLRVLDIKNKLLYLGYSL